MKLVQVKVNGLYVVFDVDETGRADYADVVDAADMTGQPSITWRCRDTGRSGILSPGGSVELREDMVFNVCHTGDA